MKLCPCQVLIPAAASSSSLSKLYLSSPREDACWSICTEALARFFAGKSSVLDLSHLQLPEPLVQAVAIAAGCVKDIELLLCGAPDSSSLLKALGALPASLLHKLNASGNAMLGDDGIKALAECIKTAPLHTLSLANTGIGTAGIEALAMWLNFAKGLQALDLSENPGIADDGAKALADWVESISLQTLRLANTGIGTAGIEVLAMNLMEGLQVLDLSNNPGIADDGAK
ncbi:Nod2, partial [Symbiodinium natans]